ncbi:hypothetical protein GCM10017567_57060 [Amycolatopsis bullii]|uniref:Secreted protein n=2 Tax=Pseudonocardiaceae TaxID=2070 RepID=A0ABQ3KJE2_9PSEU|nr:hypothetical protein GCM10017567_57060 [Amycolatopsis bullii]
MIMWTPLVTLIALVLLTAVGAATGVALTTTDHQRAARALTLLKVLSSAHSSAAAACSWR